MDYKKAIIRWHNKGKCGLSRRIPSGVMYYPTILLDNDLQNDLWSICFEVTEIDEHGESEIEFTMLVNNMVTNEFFQKLITGTTFSLTEGTKIIATGYIV